jgi:hypothetical protein
VNLDGAVEAFKWDFAQGAELQPFPNAQFGNDVRYQNFFRLCMRAEPSGQLNGASKKIVVMLDGFPGSAADPNFNLMVFALLLAPGQLALNLRGAADRGRCRYKRGHNAVPGMFDLASVGPGHGVPHYRVVDVEKFHGPVISEALRQRGGADDVRKQNGSDSGISCIGCATRN